MRLLVHNALSERLEKEIKTTEDPDDIIIPMKSILDMIEASDGKGLSGNVAVILFQTSPDGVRNAVLMDLHKIGA